MPGKVARAAALAAVAVALIPACSRGSTSSAAVSAPDLQKGLADQLTQAGTPSTAVNCPRDLAGEVGATARCDVTLGPGNGVTALLTTTQVSAGKVDWEVTGVELTKDQVTQRVAGLTAAQSVDCDSGLDGRPGSWVQCRITRNAVTVGDVVQVKDVKGLAVDLTLTSLMPQQQLEESVADKATPLFARRPDQVHCPGDLLGQPGTTAQCIVTLGDKRKLVIVTVTGMSGTAVNIEVSRPQAVQPGSPAEPNAGGADLCHGCPG